MEDERSFYIFCLLPWKTSVLFLFYYLRPWATSVLFLFSANPMLQRHSFSCFFSMGLISNSHRVEAVRTSSSWKSASMRLCRWPRLCGGCSCPPCESIARQRQRICRAIVRRLTLDSFRLKSTGGQGEKLNFATQKQEFYKYYSWYCAYWLTL